MPEQPGTASQIPEPSFASVHIEFTDGTTRAFHVHKPLQVDVDITRPVPDDILASSGDLGAFPPAINPPALPEIAIRMKAGTTQHQQVMTFDSRTETPSAFTGRLLARIAEQDAEIARLTAELDQSREVPVELVTVAGLQAAMTADPDRQDGTILRVTDGDRQAWQWVVRTGEWVRIR